MGKHLIIIFHLPSSSFSSGYFFFWILEAKQYVNQACFGNKNNWRVEEHILSSSITLREANQIVQNFSTMDLSAID